MATVEHPIAEQADQAMALAERLRGDVIGARDPGYDEARKLYNAMIDKRPRADRALRRRRRRDRRRRVSRASTTSTVAVRGGGHNGGGLGSVDDGLVIDLSPMNGVRVDPERAHRARVLGGCAGGRCRPRHARLRPGRARAASSRPPASAGSRSAAASATSRASYGLTIDNLLEADVVLADGTFVTASEDENDDLFWALRGGGGNFGVVTSFTFRLSPVQHGRRRPDALRRSSARPRSCAGTGTSSRRRPRT